MFLGMSFLFIICILGSYVYGRYSEFCYSEKMKYFDKYPEYQQTMLRKAIKNNRENGRNLLAFFKNRDIRSIAVYGLGAWKNEFSQDIDEKYFDNVYYVDKNAAFFNKEKNIKVYLPEELPNLNFDICVVTSVVYYKEIRKQLKRLGIMQDVCCYSELVYNAVKEEA